jgi:hypothetical protein
MTADPTIPLLAIWNWKQVSWAEMEQEERTGDWLPVFP